MLKKGTKVELNKAEQLACKVIAKLRFENNRKENTKNSKIGPQSNEDTDLEGIAAEFAFCKLNNLYPDFSVFTRSSKNNTDCGDVKLNNGATVDVKSTKYPTGKLLAVPWKKPTSTYMALMVGSFPKYEFKGIMESEELINPKRLGNLGHGETYIARQEELKDLT